jgi:nucleoid-associated protein YgaU
MSTSLSEFFINLDKEASERYDMSRFMNYDTDNHDPLTSNFLRSLQALQPQGQYTVQGEDGRPDNLSFKIYGSTQYWWIILLYNGISEFDKISTGDVLNYPGLDSLEDLYFGLKAKELGQST